MLIILSTWHGQYQVTRMNIPVEVYSVVTRLRERQMTAISLYCRGTLDYIQTAGVLPKGCDSWVVTHRMGLITCECFATLPLDQPKSLWSHASRLPMYHLLKTLWKKIRSTQCLLDNENNLIWIPKENMLVIIMHKNPCGEKSMMKHIA